MSSIFYYSNYCQFSKSLLQKISKNKIKDQMHFICIDRRKKEGNATYIILENGQEILLPNTVAKVPALLLLNRGHHVLFGSDIDKHIEPEYTVLEETKQNNDPDAFMFESNGFGVVSDNFSFLDQTSDDLSAKGQGGVRQLYHYARINHEDKIETPPDTYSADKIGEVSIENLEKKRNSEIK